MQALAHEIHSITLSPRGNTRLFSVLNVQKKKKKEKKKFQNFQHGSAICISLSRGDTKVNELQRKEKKENNVTEEKG